MERQLHPSIEYVQGNGMQMRNRRAGDERLGQPAEHVAGDGERSRASSRARSEADMSAIAILW
ncbi:hypothetical protein [Nonomuraea sp. NPDC050643]|uniref:hypothetical protein n=1 Tax=Nonomuraea sp. NPDC050643 TaxID=3155660 RepID=UPI0033D00CC2